VGTLQVAKLVLPALALWAFAPIAMARDVNAGRLKVEWADTSWRAKGGLAFAVRSSNGEGDFRGEGALLQYTDKQDRLVAVLFVGTTWSEGGATMSGTCNRGRDSYLREFREDGFVTRGCAMVGASISASQLSRVSTRLAEHADYAKLPGTGHPIMVLVTSKNGGVVLIEGFVAQSFGMAEPYEWPFGAPKPIPLPLAAFVGALGEGAIAASKAIFPKISLPSVSLIASADKP
jgi:hypothetical protein